MKKLMASLVFGFTLIVGGCAQDQVLVHTTDEVAEMEPAQKVQAVIDNNNAMIYAAAAALDSSYEDGLVTRAQGQAIFDKLQAAHSLNKDAKNKLIAGEILLAGDRAALVKQIVTAITSELAKQVAEQENAQ